jgi:hypothetical protein
MHIQLYASNFSLDLDAGELAETLGSWSCEIDAMASKNHP